MAKCGFTFYQRYSFIMPEQLRNFFIWLSCTTGGLYIYVLKLCVYVKLDNVLSKKCKVSFLFSIAVQNPFTAPALITTPPGNF